MYSCNSTTTDSYCCYDGCDCRANSGSEIFTFAQSPADVYTLTIIGESYTQTRTSTSLSASSTTSATTSAQPSASDAAASNAPAFSTGPSASNAGASSTPTDIPADASPAKKSNTTALGVGLGVGIPAAALIGVGIFFLLRRRRRNVDSPPSEMAADEHVQDPTSPSTKYAYTHEAEVPVTTTHASGNLDGDVPAMHELDGQGPKPVELPAPGTSASSTAGARAVEMESPLSSPRDNSSRDI